MDNKVFILIGSNQGKRLENLRIALNHLQNEVGSVIALSSVYSTQAWGITQQPEFLNAIVEIQTKFTAEKCLELLMSIEEKMGRKRKEKWGPRIIDLDVLYFNSEIIKNATLEVPHPGISNRRFTLVPLCEISPNYIHPVFGKSNLELLDECSDQLKVNFFYKLDTST